MSEAFVLQEILRIFSEQVLFITSPSQSLIFLIKFARRSHSGHHLWKFGNVFCVRNFCAVKEVKLHENLFIFNITTAFLFIFYLFCYRESKIPGVPKNTLHVFKSLFFDVIWSKCYKILKGCSGIIFQLTYQISSL